MLDKNASVRRRMPLKALLAASVSLIALAPQVTLAHDSKSDFDKSHHGDQHHKPDRDNDHHHQDHDDHHNKKRPNILYIVADDLGYSDIGAFGGEIHTPNLDELAGTGTILTNFHTSAVCAVTRSELYSGTDHHLVGEGTMGAPNDERRGLPGYEGFLNDRALSIAQLLRDGGYHTYIAGKWHLGSDIALGQTPVSWGFERSYTLLGGAARDHFGNEAANSRNYASDGQYVQPGQPGQPGGDGTQFYDTDFYTDQLISYINSNIKDKKPFVAFATYTSPHWPLQVPEPYLSKYKGVYDGGYDSIRQKRFARQKKLGIVPSDFKPYPDEAEALVASPATPNNGTPAAKYINALNPNPPDGDPSYVDYGPGLVNPRWESLTPEQKRTQARYKEIYAGQVENLDHNIGRLIKHLKKIGEYDNTFIIFHSDNGAEGLPLSAQQEAVNQRPENFAKLGLSGSNVEYGLRWAEVSHTPFRQFKGTTYEGGVSVPAIVRLPGQKKRTAHVDEFIQVKDSAPTLLALAGLSPPTKPAPPAPDSSGVDQNAGKVVYDGRNVYPISGKSFLGELEEPRKRFDRDKPLHTQAVGEEIYGRTYLRRGPWKAVFAEPPRGPVDGHWQLFNVASDRGETKDLSKRYPAVLQSLISDWKKYMKKVGGVEPLRPRGYY